MHRQTPPWIDPIFRDWMRGFASDRITSIEAFHAAIRQLSVVEGYSELMQAMADRNWVAVEHQLKAIDHRLSHGLPDDILNGTNLPTILEKASLIKGIRMLTRQAHCFRDFPDTPMGRPNGHG